MEKTAKPWAEGPYAASQKLKQYFFCRGQHAALPLVSAESLGSHFEMD